MRPKGGGWLADALEGFAVLFACAEVGREDVARKLTASREMLLWMTPSEAPKALHVSECSELLDPMRPSCRISAQHSPGKLAQVGRQDISMTLTKDGTVPTRVVSYHGILHHIHTLPTRTFAILPGSVFSSRPLNDNEEGPPTWLQSFLCDLCSMVFWRIGFWRTSFYILWKRVAQHHVVVTHTIIN